MRYRTIVADPPWPIGDFPAWFREERQSERERLIGLNPTPYKVMGLDHIKALPVRSLVAVEAHLYLWTTAGFLREAYDVAEAWGFEVMYPLVWCKPPMGVGLGGKFASNVEFVLFCRDKEGALRITSALADAAKVAGISHRDIDRLMGTSDMAGWWLSRLPHRAKVPTWEQWLELKKVIPVGDAFDVEVYEANLERGSDRRIDTRWWVWGRGAHSVKPEAFLDVVESVSPGPYLELFARRNRLGWDTWGNEAIEHVELGPHE